MLEGKADEKMALREELNKLEEAEQYFGKHEAFTKRKEELKRRLEANPVSDYDNKKLNDKATDLFGKSFQQCSPAERQKVIGSEGMGTDGKPRNGNPKTDDERQATHGKGELPPRGKEVVIKKKGDAYKVETLESPSNIQKGDRIRILNGLYTNEYAKVTKASDRGYDLTIEKTGEKINIGRNTEIAKAEAFDSDSFKEYLENINKPHDSLKELFNLQTAMNKIQSLTLPEETKNAVEAEVKTLWDNRDYVGNEDQAIKDAMKKLRL